MKVLEKGHVYAPAIRSHEDGVNIAPPDDGSMPSLVFVNKQPGQEHNGTTTQEVIRCLIDRTRHCNNCMPHPNNERVIYHLRMALVLHEARALERKAEKGDFMPEYIQTGADGHFHVENGLPGQLDTTVLAPHKQDWQRECNHVENAKPENRKPTEKIGGGDAP